MKSVLNFTVVGRKRGEKLAGVKEPAASAGEQAIVKQLFEEYGRNQVK